MSETQSDLAPLSNLVLDLPGSVDWMGLFRQPSFAHLLYDLPGLSELTQALDGQLDPAQLAAAVADPNTPVEQLVALAAIYPAELCANPVFPFLLFENPSLPATMPRSAMGRLLSYSGLPRDFVAAAAAFAPPELALAARHHVALAGELGEGWQPSVEQALLQLPTVPEDDLLLVLLILGLVPSWMYLRLGAGASPRLAAALCGEVPSTGDHVRQRLAAPATGLPAASAAEPTTLEGTLEQWADSEDWRVRCAVIANLTASPALLGQIYEHERWLDNEPAVFEALAANPRTLPDTLIGIAADGSALNTEARRALAHNPAAPPEALALLVDEPYAADIRLALVAHPAFAYDLRTQLISSSIEQALYDGDPFYRSIALAQGSLAPARLLVGARSFSWLDRLAVACNPATPAEGLALLAEDGNRIVRAAARESIQM